MELEVRCLNEYMFEVANEGGDLISFATDDADEVFPDDED